VLVGRDICEGYLRGICQREYLQIRVHDREEDLHEEIDCIDNDTE